jgi:hypothetical protein
MATTQTALRTETSRIWPQERVFDLRLRQLSLDPTKGYFVRLKRKSLTQNQSEMASATSGKSPKWYSRFVGSGSSGAITSLFFLPLESTFTLSSPYLAQD